MPGTDSNLDKLANASAFLGKADAIWDIIVGAFFSIICFGFSIYLFKKEDEYGNNKIKGTVINSLCTQYKTKKNRNNWDCSLNIQYNIDNNQYLKNNYDLENSTKKYNNGDSIDLRYKTDDKNVITHQTYSNKTLAIILMVISFFLIVIPVVWYILLTKSKNLATAAGAVTAAKIIF